MDEEADSKMELRRNPPPKPESQEKPKKRTSADATSVLSVQTKLDKPLNIMSVSPALEKGGSYDPYADISTANMIGNKRGHRNE